MKRSFTLVELLISVTIVVLTLGGGIIYFNNFNQKQKMDKVEKQVVTNLELARSYARTRQVPIGFTGGDLVYVQVQIDDGYMVVGANGIGSTFFNDRLVNGGSIGIGISPAVVYFQAGSGKVSIDGGNSFLGENERVIIQIQRSDDINEYREIMIDVLGQIQYSIPTKILPPLTSPSPTVFVCRNAGQTCTLSPQCCTGACYSGTCMDCRPEGIECIADLDCCGGNCYGGFCSSVLPTGVCPNPGETNPYYLESPPYSGICKTIYSCGYSDQICL